RACPGMSPSVALSAKAVEGMSPRKGLALGALLSGRGVTAAAEVAGVNRKAIGRWLSEDPEFISLFNSLKTEMHESIRQRLVVLPPKSIKVISSLLSRRATPPGVRLKAATAVLDLVLSGPPDGLTEEVEARAEVTLKKKKPEVKCM